MLGVVLAGTDCARPNPDDPPAPDLRNAEITLQVVNQHWLDVNVYLVTLGGNEDRVGTVNASSTRTFPIPWTRIGRSQFRLKADPIGARTPLYTDPVTVQPSSAVEWTIRSGLRGSVVSVF